jgi:hypothetical protein
VSLGTLTLRGIVPKAEAPAREPLPTDAEFWFVWAPTELRPKKRHETREGAIGEARRLRELFPEKQFLVYHATQVEA